MNHQEHDLIVVFIGFNNKRMTVCFASHVVVIIVRHLNNQLIDPFTWILTQYKLSV